MSRHLLLKLFLVLAGTFVVGVATADEAPWRVNKAKTASEIPVELQDVDIVENLNQQLDLNLEFTNEENKSVKLGDYINGKKPVLLSLVYYGCPGLCNFHLNGVTEAFKAMQWNLGNEFEMVVVSIDPSEGADLASNKKKSHIEELGKGDVSSGWHFLTGKEESIKALAKQIGFGYKWDEASSQWAHSAAMYAVTPTGKLARYLYGIHFDPATVKLALVEAGEGKAGTVMDRLVMYCFQYDPNKKGYAFYAYNIVRAGAGIAGLALAVVLIPTWLRERRRSKSQGDT